MLINSNLLHPLKIRAKAKHRFAQLYPSDEHNNVSMYRLQKC